MRRKFHGREVKSEKIEEGKSGKGASRLVDSSQEKVGFCVGLEKKENKKEKETGIGERIVLKKERKSK